MASLQRREIGVWLVAYLRDELRPGAVRESHGQLRGINASAEKIGSFTLSGVAFVHGLRVTRSCHLLQSVDR